METEERSVETPLLVETLEAIKAESERAARELAVPNRPEGLTGITALRKISIMARDRLDAEPAGRYDRA